MATYKQLRCDPVSRELFSNRITTLQGLYNLLKNSAFIAIDTEHFPLTSGEDRILHQVGLAHITSLLQDLSSTNTNTSRPHLQDFYAKSEIRALTLNINIRRERLNEIIRLKGDRGVPARRRHRFGREQQIDVENLEDAIINFICSCNSKTKLVLIGFEMAAEWTYLSRSFPRAIPFFSAWVDLRDIAKDITSSVGAIPGLVSLLQIFRYHSTDIQPVKRSLGEGRADNAGDDAVATCALANALLDSENQEKLKFRQECANIARTSNNNNGFQSPTTRDRFVATIRAKGPLPSMISSGIKVVRTFFNYSPQTAGIMSKEMAFLTFKSQNQLDNFIAEIDQLKLPTGEIILARCYTLGYSAFESEENRRKEKHETRQRKRLEEDANDFDDDEIGSLFS